MIHLVLRNFRCYSSLEKSFESGRTLLSGLSGSGKTTILCGIYWILFDKLEHIKGVEGKKPYGQLTIGNVRIERSKQPNNLIVSIDTNVYENTIGQLKINEIFGSELAWMTTSYISQGNRNALLEATGQKRFNIIRSLLFLDTNDGNSTVSSDIIKINNKLSEVSSIYDSMKIVQDTEVKGFDREWNNADVDTSYVHQDVVDSEGNVKDDILLTIHNDIVECQSRKVNLESLYQSYLQEELKRKWHIDRLNLLQNEILNVDVSSFELLKHKREVELLKRLKSSAITEDVYRFVKHNVSDVKTAIDRLQYINNRLSEIGNIEDNYKDINVYFNIDYEVNQNDLYTLKHLHSLKDKLSHLNVSAQDVSSYDMETSIEQQTLRNVLSKMPKPTTIRRPIDILLLKRKLDDVQALQHRRTIEMKKVQNGQYNKDFINNKIVYGNRLISLQDDLKAYNRRNEIVDYLRRHPLEENVDKKIEEIREAILSSKAMKCPHCENSVIFTLDGSLEKISVVNCSQPIDELKRRLSSLEGQKSYCEIVKMYQNELSKIKEIDPKTLKDIKLLKQTEVNDIQSAIHKYKNVEIIDDKTDEINDLKQLIYQDEYYNIVDKLIDGYPSPKDIIDAMEYKRLSREIEETELNYKLEGLKYSEVVRLYDYQQKRIYQRDLNDEKTTILKKYDNILYLSPIGLKAIEETETYPHDVSHLASIDFNRISDLKLTYDTKIRQINTEKENIERISDRTSEIQSLKEEIYSNIDDIQTLNKVKENTTKYVYFVKRQKEIDISEIKLNETKDYVEKIAKLKTIAFKLENQLLTDAIATLNLLVLENLSRMFDEPISVRLEMEKNGKPNINLIVLYKGMEVSPGQLSGGEQDRLSLALTLAFSSMSRSPILLLDECLSSLDSKNKENALKCLRSDDKIVITVDHEAVEGYYDFILRV